MLVHLERLPKHMIKNCFVKVNIKYEKTLKFDEIKIEKHEDLDDNIYKDNVSFFFTNVCIYIFIIRSFSLHLFNYILKFFFNLLLSQSLNGGILP